MASPWFGYTQQPVIDNPALYHNLGGTAHKGGAGLFGLATTAVVDATLNPPGTRLSFPPSGGIAYLFTTVGQFSSWGPCTGGTVYKVGVWGYGDDHPGCPDVIPDFGAYFWGMGIRYSLRLGDCSGEPASGNLQTFLGVQSGVIPESSATSLNRSRLPRAATSEDVRAVIQQHERLLRERASKSGGK